MNGLERQDFGIDSLPSNMDNADGILEKAVSANPWGKRRAPRAAALLEWKGVAVSPGIAEGPAVVNPREEVQGSVKAGSILVCSCMEPSLMALLPSCRGLVCDRGGMLSPTATMARECGVPVVSSTECLANAVRDGDTVRVDADSGTVMILSRAV